MPTLNGSTRSKKTATSTSTGTGHLGGLLGQDLKDNRFLVSSSSSNTDTDTETTTAVDSLTSVAEVRSRKDKDGAGDGDGRVDGDDDAYPEGGLRSWLVVFGCWLAMFASLGLMNVLATFQSYLLTNPASGYNTGTMAWIFSLYTFASFALGLYVGPLFDKYGPRWLILSGTVCLAVSLVLSSLSYEFWHFLLAFGILSGLSGSMLFTPAVAAIGHFFKERRGFATGVAMTAGSVSGLLFPLVLQRLYVTVGLAWAVRTLAVICLVATIVANFLVRSRLPPAKIASPHPDIRIFNNKAFVWTATAAFLLELAIFIPMTYISGYTLSKGFSQAFSFNIVAIINATSVVGRVVGGYWADSLGPFNTSVAAVCVSIFACFGILLPAGGTKPGIVIFALLFGFASGSNISLVPVSVSRLCTTQAYGRYYGTCYTVVSMAVLVAVPIASRVVPLDRGDYRGLVVITGAAYMASIFAFLMAKASVVGWNLWAIF
ncbi:major facilitator superfamily domain-containing protein [Lasiosphaeria ovina]|uniref:Major facilitator superfamily domain-containing protein n=1 Tax=Lasiosphaeria ovina TaxID=92902 RepID=A0AAE0TXZ7_9PEZI|nr:major facilitator superfamily domain-containing protein [Lasiosphaeria ovina]